MHKLGPHTIKLPCPKYQEYWGWKTLPNVPWNPTLQYEPTFKCIYSISIRSLNKSDIFFPPHIYKPVLESQGLLNVLCNILQCLLLRQLRTCHLTFTRWLHYLQHHTFVLGEKGGVGGQEAKATIQVNVVATASHSYGALSNDFQLHFVNQNSEFTECLHMRYSIWEVWLLN